MVIFTVRKIERVTKLVDSFLEKTLVLQPGIGRQPIEFLAETVRRDDRASAGQLGFSKNKREYGDIEVQRRYAEEPPLRRCIPLQHGRQDFRGRILLPGEIERKGRFRLRSKNFARDSEFTLESRAELEQRLRGGRAERE